MLLHQLEWILNVTPPIRVDFKCYSTS